MNEKPSDKETFLIRKKFRFIPEFSRALKILIELEIYESNICVVSFYISKNGSDKNKYQLRAKLGAGQALSIFKACLEAYYSLDMDFAFVFCASNDLGKVEEDYARYSAYILFLTRYFKNYENYIKNGSIRLNTLMLYHQSFQYKDEADIFYSEFEKKVSSNLGENDIEKA